MRVLIVEDEYLIALEASDALEAAGCQITAIANSVKKAIQSLEEHGCDAGLLDANLNGESSEPVAEALRARNIPFLVMSGYDNNQRPPALADAPYLAKPWRPKDLCAAMLALKK